MSGLAALFNTTFLLYYLLASRPSEKDIVVDVVVVVVRNNCIGVLRSSEFGVIVVKEKRYLLLLQGRCIIMGAVGKGDHRSVFVVQVSDVMIPFSSSNSSGTEDCSYCVRG